MRARVWGLSLAYVGAIAGTAAALWVPAPATKDSLEWYGYAPGNTYPPDMTQKPAYIWVEVPALGTMVMPAAVAPAAQATTEGGEEAAAAEVPTPRLSASASADIEYEHYTWDIGRIKDSVIEAMPDSQKIKHHANGVHFNGRFELRPDSRQAYGMHLYASASKGYYDPDDISTLPILQNSGVFTVSGFYQRRFGGVIDAGALVYFTYLTGVASGINVGPMLYTMWKPKVGIVTLWTGGAVGYGINTITNYIGRAHHTFPYSLVLGAGVPIWKLFAANVELQGSHQYLDIGANVPVHITQNFDLVAGFKKTIVFGMPAWQNFKITLGASRPF